MSEKPKELEEHSAQIFELGCMERPVYLKEDADAVIAGLKAQVNGFHNRANLWLYNAQNEHNAAVAVRMENAKIKAKADKLFSVLKYLVMGDLIKDCPPKKIAAEIVKEYENGLG